MARIWMPGGGGGGADLDVVTAMENDILKGKVIVDANGNPLTGVLELSGTAADSQVLEGATFYSTDPHRKRTGSMENQGAVSQALNCGGSYVIPAGYHNGAGKVTANSLASQTSGNATGPDILSGKTAFVNGVKVPGTMGTQAGGTYTPSTSQQTISCSGKKMTGNIIINAIPSNYANISGGATVFNNGSFSYGYGWGPLLKTSGNNSISKTGETSTAYTSASQGNLKKVSLNKSIDLTKINKIVFTWTCTYACYEYNDDGDTTNKIHAYGTMYFITPSNKTSYTFIRGTSNSNAEVGAGDTRIFTIDVTGKTGYYFIAFNVSPQGIGIRDVLDGRITSIKLTA